jgi:ABC-2 type transport system permease protein
MTTTIAPPAALVSQPTRLGHVLAAERIKLLSIRSTRWTAVLAVALSAGFTALMALGLVLAPGEEGMDVEQMIASTFGPLPTLGAVGFAFLVAPAPIAILGALIVSSERATGLIESTLAAVPRRGLVVGAKLLTSGVLGFALGLLIAVASFWIAEPAFAAGGHPQPFVDALTAQVLGGGALYLGLVGTLAAALAFLVRSTAGAIGLVLGLLLVLPGIVQLVPVAGPLLAAALPSSLGAALFTPVTVAGWGPVVVGLAGLLAWVAAAALAAWARFARSDA